MNQSVKHLFDKEAKKMSEIIIRQDDEKEQEQLKIIIYRWTRVSMFPCACPPLAQIMKARMPGSPGESAIAFDISGFLYFRKEKGHEYHLQLGHYHRGRGTGRSIARYTIHR